MRILFIRTNCQNILFTRKFSNAAAKQWKSVVGLEIHAQLNTESKLFSASRNSFGGAVNCNVSLLDAAIPGSLPVLNRRCVEQGILTALALSCKINEVSTFDRKHYFYADLPAGYQITQQRAPLATDGVIHFQVYTPGIHQKPYTKSSKIKQIQLEQDSGKSLHDAELKRSLVDLNRAGAPLIELVFEPDLEDGEEAAALVKELVLIVQRLEVCTGRMEEGALRVDANVSVHRPGEPLGTRTEIKNIGSVRGVAGAIKYEIERQTEVLSEGGSVVAETRSWDAAAKITVPMRDKELVHDYRYMPEPNLPPLRVNVKSKESDPDLINVSSLKERIPELPEDTRRKLTNKYTLRQAIAIQIVNEPILLKYFIDLSDNHKWDPIKIANVLINEYLTVLNKNKISIEDSKVTLEQLRDVFEMLSSDSINLDVVKSILKECIKSSEVSVKKLVNDNDWALVNDVTEITKICNEVIENNPDLVKLFKSGKTKLLKALIGKVARNTHVKYNQSLVAKKMEELLKK